MTEKSWFQSKTIWANILAIGFVLVFRDSIPLSSEVQMTALALVNIVLRFVTSKSLTLKFTAEITAKD